MAKRQTPSLGFVAFWLGSYMRSRVKNYEMVESFSRRIANELGIAVPATPASNIRSGAGWLVGSGSLSCRRVLRELFAQMRLLTNFISRSRRGARNLLVVSDNRRLEPWNGLADLRASLAPLKPSAGYEQFTERIASADRLLIFTPNLFVAGKYEPTSAAQVGYLGLASIAVLAPFVSCRNILRHACSPRGSSTPWRSFLFWSVLTGLIDTLLQKAWIADTMLLTSNSFAVEVVRWRALMRPGAGDTIELLHGVPTREILDYLNEMTAYARNKAGSSRMTFVPTTPEVIIEDPSGLGQQADFAINPRLRQFAVRERADAVIRRILDDAPGGYRVAINGSASYPTPYFQSNLFRIEQEMIALIRRFAVSNRLNIEILYTIHPAHIKSGLSKQFFNRMAVDALAEDSVYSWLGSDLVVALLSSSIWDAHYLGAATFIATSGADNMYSAALLSAVGHLGEGQTTTQGLWDEMTRMIATPAINSDEVSRRIDKLFGTQSLEPKRGEGGGVALRAAGRCGLRRSTALSGTTPVSTKE